MSRSRRLDRRHIHDFVVFPPSPERPWEGVCQLKGKVSFRLDFFSGFWPFSLLLARPPDENDHGKNWHSKDDVQHESSKTAAGAARIVHNSTTVT